MSVATAAGQFVMSVESLAAAAAAESEAVLWHWMPVTPAIHKSISQLMT